MSSGDPIPNYILSHQEGAQGSPKPERSRKVQSVLRIGRFGPVAISLHYSWLFAWVLGLWWLALLWLPNEFPGQSSWLYWSTAVAVILLVIVSLVLHELVHM